MNPNGSVLCTGGRCDNGQSCNGVGNICGAPVLRDGGSINASQNCCNGMKDVCKLDTGGIPRCFGGFSSSCPTGYTGTAPCCIDQGDICQFRDQCCNDRLCLPADGGVLRCTTGSCVPQGGSCANGGTCCAGTSCLAGTCRPPIDAGVSCVGVEAACTFSAECCSNICVNGACAPPTVCQGQGASCTNSADCCSGTACTIPPGATFGTCEPSMCAGLGQTCALGSTSCCGGVSCIDTTTFALCGTTGSCNCATN